MITDAQMHVRVPADHLYWAVLDTSTLPAHARKRRKTLEYLFEPSLPVPIDEIQASFVHVGRDRCVACGIERERLEAERGATAVTFCPERLPDLPGLDVEAAACSRLEPWAFNLLTGAFEPRRVRRLRLAAHGQIIAMLVLTTAILLVGMARRSSAWQRHADEIQARSDQFQMAWLGPAPEGSVQPIGLRRVAELRRLRQTRGADVPRSRQADLGPELSRLMVSWPAAMKVRTEHLLVEREAITVRALVASHRDAQHLADALGQLAGWVLHQPEVATVGSEVRVAVRLTPSEKRAESS